MLWIALGGLLVLAVVYVLFLKPSQPQASAVPAPASPAKPGLADAKPTKTKPADAKPADAKPADAKPADAKPADARPSQDGNAPRKLPRLPRLHSPEPDDDNTVLTTLAPAPELPGVSAGVAKVVSHSEGAEIDEPSGLHSLILVTAVAQTDKGRRRRNNEDSYCILDKQALYLVADGMGGHAAGEVASQIATEVVGEAFRTGRFRAEAETTELPRQARELKRAIEAANAAIFERGQNERDLRGMGTTVVAACFSQTKRRAYIAHAGDSRCYRLRKGELTQLTTDHTLGVAAGVVGALGERLTRALGVAADVEVDIQLDAPEPRDLYLLCSDGLSKMVPDEQIREIAKGDGDLSALAQKLIDAANERGGRDNITVILIRVDPLS